MNKQQRLAAAKDYALAIALRKVPTAEQEAALKEAGSLERIGLREFAYRDAKGDRYVMVAPKSGRQRIITYRWIEWQAYEEASELLSKAETRRDFEEVEKRLARGVIPASLKSILAEGLEMAYRRGEIPEEDDPQRMVFELLESGLPGVEFEWIGEWVWATGDTRPNKETLKAAGFKWSAKKTAWYWKPEGSKPKSRRARYGSVDSLRKHWQAA